MRRSPTLPIALLVMTAIAAGCASPTGPTWTFAPPGPATAVPSGAPATPAPSAPTGAVVGTIAVEAFDLGFTPKEITVDAPGRYTVTLKNTGVIPHDVTFEDGATTGSVNAGQMATVDVDVPAAGLTFICAVPGHDQAGMTGAVMVKGGATYGKLPTFAINGPDDTGLGRWIPTLAVDQYSATLAKWFGVDTGNIASIFPNLSRFPVSNLGFML